MNIENIAYQPELSQSLPEICNHKEYEQYRDLVERMDEIITKINLDLNFAENYLHKLHDQRIASGKVPELSMKQVSRATAHAVVAYRCTVAANLSGKSCREFSILLAMSPLLQNFCRIARIDGKLKVPSKSSLDRYSKMFSEEFLRNQISLFNHHATCETNPFEFQDPLTVSDIFIDSTCMKARIHFPVDWVLVKDCMLTIIKAVLVCRKHGLKHRIKKPKTFISEMNALCMSMTSANRKRGDKKQKKKIFRDLKKLAAVIRKHGTRYADLLESEHENTDLSKAEAACVVKRLREMTEILPTAVKQAHSRIIKGVQVKNEDKLLSIYHEHVNVIKRGKAGGQVEFGNPLFLAEQRDGIILDWKLYKTDVKDPQATREGIIRLTEEFEYEIASMTGDRGCQSKRNDKLLTSKNIYNGLCPRNPHEFIEKMHDGKFRELQKRRAQTEGRIGIFKNVILDGSLYEKNFEGKEIKIAWAVMLHNLWCMARLPVAEAEIEQAA